MIEPLPDVQIGNSAQLFGGYIYNLSFSVVPVKDGATTLTVNIVSESGTYQISETDLDLSVPYNAQIGSFTETMYLKSYKLVKSPKGNVLEVLFIDGSFILDRFWVGLNKTVWDLSDTTTNFGGEGVTTIGSGGGAIFNTNGDGTFGSSSGTTGGGSKPNYLIVVGNEIHPCDRNWSGYLTFPDLVDPCDACINATIRAQYANFPGLNFTETKPPAPTTGNAGVELQRGILDCLDMSMTQIFDVQYHFNDLIAQTQTQTGLSFVSSNGQAVDQVNPGYRQKHTGTLREVLGRWCSDFGWTFFYSQNTIYFVDTTAAIQVADGIQDFCPDIAEYTEEHTLEGTVCGNLIMHFKRAGLVREYHCEDALYIMMNPMQGGSVSPIAPNLAITNKIDTKAAGLCHYDPYLRDLYYWFIKYQMLDTSGIVINTYLPELGLTILSDPFTLDLPTQQNPPTGAVVDPGTNLAPPNGYPLDQDISKSFLDAVGLSGDLLTVQQAILANNDFKRLFILLAPHDQWAYANNAWQYYLFIAYYDREMEAKHIRQEKDYAESFMGRYYAFIPDLTDPIQQQFFEDDRIISDITTCSTSEVIDDERLKYNSLNKNEDASVKYWNAPAVAKTGDITTIGRLPFAKWLSYIRDYPGGAETAARLTNFKILYVEIQGDGFFPTTNEADALTSDVVPGAGNVIPSTQANFPIQNKDLITMAHSYYLKFSKTKLDATGDDVVANIINVNLSKIDTGDKDNTKVFLFWGRVAQPTDFVMQPVSPWAHETQRAGYAFDGYPLNQYLDTITNVNQIVYKYPYMRCLPMGRPSNETTHWNFNTPVANFQYTEPCSSKYGVILEKQKTIALRTEKMQTRFVQGIEPNNQTLKVQVNQQDISDDDISNRIMNSNTNTCQYNIGTLENRFNELAQGMTFEQTSPLRKFTFTLAGALPSTPTVYQGLLGIDMSIDGEGVKATYTLGTTLMTPPNQDILNGLEFSSQTLKQVQNAPSVYPQYQLVSTDPQTQYS